MIVLWGPLFLLTALLLPWWVVVVAGVVLATFRYSFIFLIIGGVLLDTVFAAPVPGLGGFAYIYTVVFLAMSVVAETLRARAMN